MSNADLTYDLFLNSRNGRIPDGIINGTTERCTQEAKKEEKDFRGSVS